MDAFRGLREVREELEALELRVTGRMARVASSDGHMVMVTLPTGVDGSGETVWTGPLGPYPSTAAGVAPGTVGYLMPLRGGSWLFETVGVARVPFTWQSGTEVSTASVTTPVLSVNETIVLTTGTWRIDASFSGLLRKSVNSYGIAMHTSIDGVVVAPAPLFYGPDAYTRSQHFSWHRTVTVTVTSPRAVSIALGVLSASAAGTVYLAYGAVRGDATRIG